MTLALRVSIQKLSDIRRWLQQYTNLKKFMQIYEDHTIYSCCQKKHMLLYSSMNSYANHRFYLFRIMMSFSISSNFDYYVLKLIGKNFDAYGLMVENNLSVSPSKISIIKKILLLTI